jgi:hypothetical protein
MVPRSSAAKTTDALSSGSASVPNPPSLSSRALANIADAEDMALASGAVDLIAERGYNRRRDLQKLWPNWPDSPTGAD